MSVSVVFDGSLCISTSPVDGPFKMMGRVYAGYSSKYIASLQLAVIYGKLVKFCPFSLKILSRKQILTSIKGFNSVTNLPKNDVL